MLAGKTCELCKKVIIGSRAQHQQTKYHPDCAQIKKQEHNPDSMNREERRIFMRNFMRGYRAKHKGLSTPYVRKHRERKRQQLRTLGRDIQSTEPSVPDRLPPTRYECSSASLALLLWLVVHWDTQILNALQTIQVLINHGNVVIIEGTGLVVILILCWRHVSQLWRGTSDEKGK